MHRIDSTNAQNGRFVAGNPVTGVRPTTHTADHDNAVQEEICNAITAAGIALDKTKNDQLTAAINTLIDRKIATALAGGGSGGTGGTLTCAQLVTMLSQITAFNAATGELTFTCPDTPVDPPPPPVDPTDPTNALAINTANNTISYADGVIDGVTLELDYPYLIATSGDQSKLDLVNYNHPNLEITNA